MGTASDKASSVASSVGDAATGAPSAARQKTQGNPLAAGLIAFGAGWLISSLLPATEKEKQAASTVKDKASEHSDTLTAPLKEAAGTAKENLQGTAQDAVDLGEGHGHRRRKHRQGRGSLGEGRRGRLGGAGKGRGQEQQEQ